MGGVCYDVALIPGRVFAFITVRRTTSYDGVLQECRKNEILISKLRAKGLAN